MQSVYPKIINAIQNLDNTLTVVDICCGTGWASEEFLKCGFNQVKMIDARTEWFDSSFDKSLSGWTFHKLDVTRHEKLLPLIIGIDIICYLGHLYHTSDPELMLSTLTSSGCKHLLIETKTLLEHSHPLSKPEIHWSDEPTDLHGLAYSSDKSTVTVGRPNLRWTVEKLQNLGYTIVTKDTVYINNVSYSNPKQIVGQHFIHAIKN